MSICVRRDSSEKCPWSIETPGPGRAARRRTAAARPVDERCVSSPGHGTLAGVRYHCLAAGRMVCESALGRAAPLWSVQGHGGSESSRRPQAVCRAACVPRPGASPAHLSWWSSMFNWPDTNWLSAMLATSAREGRRGSGDRRSAAHAGDECHQSSAERSALTTIRRGRSASGRVHSWSASSRAAPRWPVPDRRGRRSPARHPCVEMLA